MQPKKNKKKQRRRSIKYSRNRITKEIVGGGTPRDDSIMIEFQQFQQAAAAQQAELIARRDRALAGQPRCLIM